MHGLAKAQRCGALPVFDGLCPVHLKERGYTRCPDCSAWRQPIVGPGLSTYLRPENYVPAAPVCDVCSSMGGPAPDGDGSQASYRALQPLDARAHAGDGEGALRELSPWRPACPRCRVSTHVACIADAAHAEAPQDVWQCGACLETFLAVELVHVDEAPSCGFALYGPPALCTCGACKT